MANPQTGYAPINGLQMYYEIHGAGFPLVLIHGSYCTIDIFRDNLLPALAQTYQVIAVELQGHGHTADIERPLSYEYFADDLAALLKHLNIKQADIMGYSLGGSVALQTTIRHPELIRKLIFMSSVFKYDGWYPETAAIIANQTAETAAMTIGSLLHSSYLQSAPNPDAWPQLWGKMGDFFRSITGFDWSADVAAIIAPTLIIVGDSDGIRLPHSVEMFGLLGGGKSDGMFAEPAKSQLAILPGINHFTILERTDLVLPIITPFLAPSEAEPAHAKEV